MTDKPTKEQALRDLAMIEDIWDMAPDLPYTRRLRAFIEAASLPVDVEGLMALVSEFGQLRWSGGVSECHYDKLGAAQASKDGDEIYAEIRALASRLASPQAQPAGVPQQGRSEAEQVCHETYAAIGTILFDLAESGHPQAEKLLDNLSEARLVHKDVLPFADNPAIKQTPLEGGGSAVDGVRGDAEVQYHWSDERLEFLRKQSNGSGSLAAQQAYINGLEFELQRALGVLASAPVDELAMLRRDLERLPKSPGKEDALRHMAELERAIASGVPPSPMPQLMERALAAMQEVQERAEPGFAPDIAIIPADDWRAFIDAHAEVQMLWAAWRDSPDGAKGSGHG
jgi:hypothetical protein